MRVVLQRCKGAQVKVGDQTVGRISDQISGYLLLVGIEPTDQNEDIEWVVRKVSKMRLIADANGSMSQSLLESNGELLLVSQFTLYASTKKGNRPSFSRAAEPNFAKLMFEQLHQAFERALGKSVSTGVFGANMVVSLTNDGPVTILSDSKDRD